MQLVIVLCVAALILVRLLQANKQCNVVKIKELHATKIDYDTLPMFKEATTM